MKMMRTGVAVMGLLAGLAGAARANLAVDFNLLTWDDSAATAELPSAVGLKPSAGLNATDDWLPFTDDDASPGAGFNPDGALSHNLAQLTGGTGPQFNNAPSLTGGLTLNFAGGSGGAWSVSPQAQAYNGAATPVMVMNQFLVGPDDPATQHPAFNVDGVVSPGVWQADAAGDWAIHYALDFYFATNADGDPSPTDVDAAFSDATQAGYLIPVDQLTEAGMAAAALTSPTGFFAGDFERYLLDEIAPRLPGDASHLLITQMSKTNPVYAEPGLPITTNTLVGNTTIAYTTQAIPEPATALLLIGGGAALAIRRRRSIAHA